jgi:peptidoglycan/xylan/chitin deacetylase (PgdA/CDA1 family)
MNRWLEPLSAVLDAAPAPVDFFLRDDDAGWDDGRLSAVLDVVGRHRLPLDLAVIPQAIGRDLARSLMSRGADWDGRLGLHQHGLAHRNHEPNGRKCEFGPSRDRDVQRRDLIEGRELLEDQLPGQIQQVFTPPWNRCTPVTAELLLELGFLVLSRQVSEPRTDVVGLAEVPVAVDWSYAKRDGRRLSWPALGELAAERAALGGPVGVNLHHAVMDPTEFELLDELCRLLARHPAARCRPLLALA